MMDKCFAISLISTTTSRRSRGQHSTALTLFTSLLLSAAVMLLLQLTTSYKMADASSHKRPSETAVHKHHQPPPFLLLHPFCLCQLEAIQPGLHYSIMLYCLYSLWCCVRTINSSILWLMDPRFPVMTEGKTGL